MKLSDIQLNPANPRSITEVKFKKLVQSLKESTKFLEARPIVIKDGVVFGGNMRLRALQELGYKEIPDEWVKDVSGWTAEDIHKFIVVDNIAYGDNDWDLLSEQYEKEELEAWGMDVDKWVDDEVVEDEVPEVTDNPVSKLGEVYQLGRHRLGCLDATKLEDIELLMDNQKCDLVLTDPPYNTGMDKKPDSTWLSHMFNDKLTNDQFEELLTKSLANMFEVSKGECAFYVCIDFRNVGKIKEALEKLMPVKNIIVWDKVVHGLGSDYKFTYEMIVVGKKGNPRIENRIGLDYQDIWRVQRTMGRNEDHATAKPIELLKKPILHASKEDDIVLDLFGGSGSTLITCEQLNRSCYMSELSPNYCDVIRKRYAKFIGKEDEWETITPCLK